MSPTKTPEWELCKWWNRLQSSPLKLFCVRRWRSQVTAKYSFHSVLQFFFSYFCCSFFQLILLLFSIVRSYDSVNKTTAFWTTEENVGTTEVEKIGGPFVSGNSTTILWRSRRTTSGPTTPSSLSARLTDHQRAFVCTSVSLFFSLSPFGLSLPFLSSFCIHLFLSLFSSFSLLSLFSSFSLLFSLSYF